jgi:hypothetical protein
MPLGFELPPRVQWGGGRCRDPHRRGEWARAARSRAPRILALAAAGAATTLLAAIGARPAAASTWNGGNGPWSGAANWTGEVPNSPTINAFIDNGAGPSIVTLDIDAAVGGFTLDNDDQLLFNADARTLSVNANATVNGVIDLAGGAGGFAGVLSCSGSAAQTIGGSGSITFGGAAGNGGGSLNNEGTNTLTIGTGVLIHGKNGSIDGAPDAGVSGGIVNQGTIAADVSGGTLTLTAVTNAGSIQASNGGTLSFSDAASGNVVTGTLTGGSWKTFANSTISLTAAGPVTANAASIVLAGTGSTFLSGASHQPLESTLTANQGSLQILGGRSYIAPLSAGIVNSGTLQLSGGVFAPSSLTNTATGQIFGFGAITPTVINAGTVRATGGTLVCSGGISGNAGTIQIDADGVLDLSSASTASSAAFLIHNGTAAGSLNLGTDNVTISGDYTNAAFGVGDTFDRRANVSGSGLIRAGGNVGQSLGGPDVSNGTSATPTMTFGNVHVGDIVTRNFRVNNTGSNGPVLRGAIQTSVNGGNITDPRLSGAGITAANFGPIALGSSTANFPITFTAATPGSVSGQVIHITSNFDNLAAQNLQIVNSAAYRLASADVTPISLNFGIVHVGDSVAQQPITITNTAPNDGFSESLSVSFAAPSAPVTAGGSITRLAPGASNGSSLLIGLNTTTAAIANGNVTLNLISDGLGTSNLGTSALSSQSISVSGTVNNYASPTFVFQSGSGTLVQNSATSYTLDLGAIRKNTGTLTANLGVMNRAIGPSDTLAGAFAVNAPDFATSGFASFSNIAASSTQGGQIISLSSTNIGSFSGTVTLSTQSQNPQPFSLNLPDVTLTVTGSVPQIWTETFIGPSGNWSTATNWTPLGQPQTEDYVFITGTSGAVAVTYDNGVTPALTSELTIDATGTSGASRSLIQPGNTLVTVCEYVGRFGAGSVSQTGGIHAILGNGTNALYLGYNAGASGTYTLAGTGSLSTTASEYVGYSGAGNFIQNGGSNVVSQDLSIGHNPGATGVYTLSAGTLSVANSVEYLGFLGSGTFNQSGGSNTVFGMILGLGASGVGAYNLSNGASLSVAGEIIGSGGAGVFNQTGGSHAIGQGAFNLYLGYTFGSTGAYNLSGGSLTLTNSEYIGNSGAGTFTQTGGTHAINDPGTNGLFIGFANSGSGTYTLSAGTLTIAGSEHVGFDGAGSFIQSGGSHAVGVYLVLGDDLFASGAYTLSAGTLSIAGQEYVGSNGAGVFNQSGGTHTAVGLNLGYGTFSAGTYNLSNSASLSVGNETIGVSGFGAFNQTGGNHTIGQSLLLASGTGSTGTFFLSAGQASAASVFIGGSTSATGGSGLFTIAGGTLNVPGTLKVWNSGTSALNLSSGVLNAGALDLSGTPSRLNWTGGTLNLTGSGLLIDPTGALGSFINLTATQSLVVAGSITNAGTLQLSGGTVTTPGLANTGLLTGFGSINAAIANTGTIRARNGTLAPKGSLAGTGTVRIDPSGILDLTNISAPTAGLLIQNGTSPASLSLGTNNITVTADYTNASFGAGNAFNGRARVSGSGLILAGGDVGQSLGGDVSGATSAVATLTFGRVHVGDIVTRNYTLNNTGSTGPALRGAIQTATNGGNITDPRLTGAGVTAANFGPIAPGSSTANLPITFTASSAGTVSGQVIHITSNFDNIAAQNLQIVDTAAYRYASATAHLPEPIVFPNRHVGDPATQALTITNNVPADGFSESLDAAFGTLTGPITAGGSFTLLAPGATNNSSLTVGLNTTTAGANTGTAVINLISDGAGTSNMGTTALSSQTVNLSGNVYRFASASAHLPEPINFGNLHLGDAATAAISISNLAINDGFSESLDAAFGALTGAATASGSFNLLAAGATNNTSLAVGLVTTTVGAKTGTAVINLLSDGQGTSNLGTSALSSQTVSLSATVYRLASASAHLPATVNFGNVHVGDALTQAITLSNLAQSDGFSEKLDASFTSFIGAATGSGSFTLLAPGATNTALSVSLLTTTVGAKSGTATLALLSNGQNTSNLGTTALPSQSITITGGVYRLASASPIVPDTIDFGIIHVGDAATRALAITNTATADAFSEGLDASFGAPTGTGLTAVGSISQLAAGANNNTSLTVGLNTTTAGAKSGTVPLRLLSDGLGTSGLGTSALSGQTITLSGTVNNYAAPLVVFQSGNGSLTQNSPTSYTLDLGAIRRNTGTLTATLAVSNNAAAPADTLAGSFAIIPSPYVTSGFSSFSNLAAGATQGGQVVSLSSTNFGSITGMIILSPQSQNPRPFSSNLAAVTIALTASVPDIWTETYTGPTGSWSTAANWTPTGAPQTADYANITATSGGSVTVTYDAAATAVPFGQLIVDATGAGVARSLSLTANSLTAGLEYVGFTGAGSVTQTGGTHSVTANGTNGLFLGYAAGSSGTYTLSGAAATLSVPNAVEYIGFSGAGTFNQSAGTHSVAAFLLLGNNAGSLGTYNQSGGVNTDGGLILGASAGSAGTYNLSNSASLTALGGGEFIGQAGSGSFNQTGGDHNVEAPMYLGYTVGGSGSYALSGGNLTVSGNETIGYAGAGSFIQTGGMHQISVGGTNGLFLGCTPTGAGTFTLSGGTLLTPAAEYVGFNGRGTLNQSGGTHAIGGSLFVAFNPGSTGTVTISGGQLSASGLVNNGSFNQSGGSSIFGPVTGSGAITIGGGAGTALVSVPSITQPTLAVTNNGTLVIRTAANRITNQVTNLQVAGTGTLDLNNHELLTTTSPAAIKSYLAHAYDPNGNADWGQPGLSSSIARSNPTSFSLGYAYGGDPSAQDAGVSTHGGTPLAPNQTIVRAVLTGDANMDGTVDFFDISQVLGYRYNAGGTNAPYTDGDLDYSGQVDFFDIVLLLSANYNSGQVFGPAAAAPRAAPSLTHPARAATPSVTGAIASATKSSSATAAATTTGDPTMFDYDPSTGDLRFRANDAIFTTTGGQPSFVSSLVISSASGLLKPAGASLAFANGTGATLTSTLLASAMTSSPGFPDGFDIGIVLPAGLTCDILTPDLIVKYQVLNGGGLRTSAICTPEPAGLALLGLGAMGLAARRRRREPGVGNRGPGVGVPKRG